MCYHFQNIVSEVLHRLPAGAASSLIFDGSCQCCSPVNRYLFTLVCRHIGHFYKSPIGFLRWYGTKILLAEFRWREICDHCDAEHSRAFVNIFAGVENVQLGQRCLEMLVSFVMLRDCRIL